MDTLKSKVAYLQGLSDGMDLPSDSKEGRLLNGIIDVLQDFAEQLEGLEEAQEQLEDYVETIDEDLYNLEEDLNDCECCDDEDYMEVECPGCGETVMFHSDILEDDDIIEVTCPNCDEVVFVNDDQYSSADEGENMEGQQNNR
ncbi:CD1247 N-terminal domain-containing protein [Desulforamulus ferrireducens]|uniref:AraC family transcriptional regulator n=1 Tax=Desulforamulus ferrireducens TaxID=1833852 RepID=A0A1S6IUP4_9FIRM|nr:CD1247 N-terminal domain-containing protein [Desulforamulus ferrireducens]AQS58489.1 AraC family transcriptional regulator [Desulforamulus ferrireducens]